MTVSLYTDCGHNTAALDMTVIRIDQLRALAGLLSLKDVAEEFAGLPLQGQASIFDLFEDGLGGVRAVLARDR
ncbi:hypothetical protein E2553_17200 [Paraburkholderia dipogonis]|uniref:Uncharacterized protein n=1 Tax=Paraburkholderia dipogonis TaxID=1211383 RepID=A0A4Y8NAA3_9BURK|nr:hypothetical protein [Paraburkholderia dipogonis]TFE46622.1 hypothetical protein E2553_17200 [Paraburkholderia dipogonis]